MRYSTCCMNTQRSFTCGEDYLGMLVLEIETLMPTSTWQDQRENWTCQATCCQTHNLNSFITNRHIHHLTIEPYTKQSLVHFYTQTAKMLENLEGFQMKVYFPLNRFSQSQSWILATLQMSSFQNIFFFDNNTTHYKKKKKAQNLAVKLTTEFLSVTYVFVSNSNQPLSVFFFFSRK